MTERSGGMMKEALASVHQTADGRYYGVCSGFCLKNTDPLHLGRIKAYIPVLHGPAAPDPDALSWAWPCSPHGGNKEMGTLLIPDPGCGIWVLFENGSTNHPVYLGSWWAGPKGESEAPGRAYEGDAPAWHILFRYGDMALYAKKDGEEVTLSANDKTVISLYGENRARVQVEGASVEVTNDFIEVKNAGGCVLRMENGNVSLSAPGTLTLSGSLVKINGAIEMN